MTSAYDGAYLAPAKRTLGRMLDFACCELGFGAGEFWKHFLGSGTADAFGAGEPRLVAGMSGVELAYEVLDRAGVKYRRLRSPACSAAESPERWAGKTVAHYQWLRGFTFAEIADLIPITEIVAMRGAYHGQELSRFVGELDRRYRERFPDSNLKRARLQAGLSQGELATVSGIRVRTIQELEQRRKDVNKAQLDTLYPLAAALHRPVASLLERVP